MAFIDEICRAENMGEHLRAVGWIRLKYNGIFFPNFTRHNGESAKKRVKARERQRLSRSARHKDVTKKCDKSVTREEKRREEKSKRGEEAPVINPDLPDGVSGHIGPFHPATMRDDKTGQVIEKATPDQLRGLQHLKGLLGARGMAWKLAWTEKVYEHVAENGVAGLVALTDADLGRAIAKQEKAGLSWGIGWVLGLLSDPKPRQRQDGPRVNMEKFNAAKKAEQDAKLAKIRDEKKGQ